MQKVISLLNEVFGTDFSKSDFETFKADDTLFLKENKVFFDSPLTIGIYFNDGTELNVSNNMVIAFNSDLFDTMKIKDINTELPYTICDF